MLYSFLNQVNKIKSTNADYVLTNVENNSFYKRNCSRRKMKVYCISYFRNNTYTHLQIPNTTFIYSSSHPPQEVEYGPDAQISKCSSMRSCLSPHFKVGTNLFTKASTVK